MTGGKRKGAGRKPSSNSANIGVCIRLTKEKHEAFKALGGSKWIKRQIDEQTNLKKCENSIE